MRYLTYVSLVFTMLLWGGTFIAGRSLAGSVSPAAAAFFRFTIATIALAVLVRLIDGRIIIPPRKLWFRLLLLGATGIFSYNICFFTGLQYLEAGRASLIIALNPLAIVLGATLILGELLTFKQVCGILISLVGAFLVITNGHPGMVLEGGFGTGELAILGCVASWAAYSIIGRTVLSSLTPLSAVFYSSLCGTLLLLPYALADGSVLKAFSYSSSDWLSLGFLGLLGTAVGFSLYYRAIQAIGASRASVFINLVPFFAIILSWFFLDESIGLAALSGGLLLLAGVTLTNRGAAVKVNKTQ
ncbi:DMT family transporter [Desulfosediminicola ganghwensis]|uniref:DMT family transporter n=1 Tax=Desulfosediminicola ganghwensis TaxID=2569540 RepID=UPI0010AD831C|nr:DMT family transporter [Desulfosediminicola ganghwensis]